MVEPISLIATGAIIGGVAGKFTEKVWNLGEKWVTDYFSNHGAKAQENAKNNTLDFLNKLAIRVKNLEKEDKKNKKLIENSLSHPGFSILLQKAMLSSAQTEDKQKHELLARLISDRLSKQSESIHSLTSKLAVDAISSMTINQLKLVALSLSLSYTVPKQISVPINSNEMYNDLINEWISLRFEKLLDIEFSRLDLAHLEALSCITFIGFASVDLSSLIVKKFEHEKFKFNFKEFIETETGKKTKFLWDKGICSVNLTSLGQLIGVYVSDMITGTNTNLPQEWG